MYPRDSFDTLFYFKVIGSITNFMFIMIAVFYSSVTSELFNKCDIALKLANSFGDSNLADQWVCIAEKLTNLNSSALKRHRDLDVCRRYTLGIFQISNDWCSSFNDNDFGICKRNGCKLDCQKLLDGDVNDDIECIKLIHEFDGFKYWPPIVVNECLQKTPNTDWNITECLNSNAITKHRKRDLTSIPLWSALLIIAFSSFIVFSLTYIFYRYRRNRVTILSSFELQQFKYGKITSLGPRLPPSGVLECIEDNFTNEPYNIDFEISPKDFVIGIFQVYDYGKCLGSGAFGIVYKASCKGKVVAAKALKPEATKEYLQSLLGEIKILCHIGRHDCIVNLEGAYTKNLQKGIVYVFTEYCSLGSLDKFLRSNRSNYLSLEEIQKNDTTFGSEITCTSTNIPGDSVKISFKNLLQYAHQIAKGMEFLSSKQVIHGDLAARNVLLIDTNTAKISDFGLSRKLYGYINYVKKKEEPLPWRWMSIESLRDLHFSTASDVWMYGVLLYEVFSLGEVPYPGLSWSLEFVENLEKGFRMLKPRHAPANIYYDVLLKCYETVPSKRPSFSSLTSYFHQALHKITAMDYTELVLVHDEVFKGEEK